jgi:hypothetical protein
LIKENRESLEELIPADSEYLELFTRLQTEQEHTFAEDWPEVFVYLNGLLLPEEQWLQYPDYSKCPFLQLSESLLALLFFQKRKRLLGEQAPQNLVQEHSSLRPSYLNNQALLQPGRFMAHFIASLQDDVFQQLRMKVPHYDTLEPGETDEVPSTRLSRPVSIQTDGTSLKLVFREPLKRAIGAYEQKSKLRPYDLKMLLSGESYNEKFSKQQWKDTLQVRRLQSKKDMLEITWFGFDSGEINPSAYAARLTHLKKLAFSQFSRDKYYNHCHEPTIDFINRNKSVTTRDNEARLSLDPLNEELDYECFQESKDYYCSKEVRSKKEFSNKKKIASFDLFVDQMLKAAGASSNFKASEYEAWGKAFVFVFETGASFGKGRKGSRSPMHVELQNHVIKKVRLN